MNMQQDDILTDIDFALAAQGCSAMRFGYLATGDPGILRRLRRGRRGRPALLAKLRDALERLEQGKLL